MPFKNKINEFSDNLSRGPVESLFDLQTKSEVLQNTSLSGNLGKWTYIANTKDISEICRRRAFLSLILITLYYLDSSYIDTARKSSKPIETSVISTFPSRYATQNGKSPVSSEITPQVRMDPPNCSSTPFRTPRSVRRGSRSKHLFGSPALPYQSSEDRILGMKRI